MRNSLTLLIIFLVTQHTFAISTVLMRDPFSMQTQHVFSKPIKPRKESWVPLYFVKVNNILPIIKNKNSGLLSSRGIVQADLHGNQLWIKDDLIHINRIKHVIAHLDHRIPQFLIRAQIVMIDKNYQKILGFHFNNVIKKNTQTNIDSVSDSNTNDSNNSFSFNIASLAQNHLINLKLSALEKEGHAKLISKPVLITLNNKMASIESGAEVPYEEATSSGAASISFKKAVLSLKVTPQALPEHQVLLHIKLNQDKVSALTVKGVPAIETQQMTTQVITQNGRMIMLGGILEENHALQTDSIPFLSHTPILGALFQHHHTQNEKQVLLICITPTLLLR